MRFKNSLFWLGAFISLLLDRLTKYWIVNNFALSIPPESLPLELGVFHITYVTNTGAAFNLFNHNGDWLRWLSLAVSLGLIGLACLGSPLSRWQQSGYGFILGGALGNGIDRFVSGKVVDFLDFRLINFAVFNIADISINLGIVFLIASFWQKSNFNRNNSVR